MNTTRRAHAGLLPIFLAALASVAPAQQEPEFELFKTPDGSRFLLVPYANTPVIYWVIATPAGDLIDPPAFPGLSFAVTRASLSGTDTIGTRSWKDERKALGRIDRLEGEIDAHERRGEDLPPNLPIELARAKRQLASLQDTSEWVRELRNAPAIDFELRELPEAVLLGVTTTPRGLAQVARLIMDRRENAKLRTIDRTYREVSAERTERRQALRERLRAEVRNLAFFGLGTRDADPSLQIDREVAETLHDRTQCPAAAYNVITGGFELEAMKEFLRSQFNSTRLRTPPRTAPQPIRTSRERSSTIPGERQAVAIAFQLPPDLDGRAVQVFGEWLAGGNDSYLATQLRAAGRIDVECSVTTPFPASASPGLMLIEVWQGSHSMATQTDADLLGPIRSALTMVTKRPQSDWKDLDRARKSSSYRSDIERSDPAKLAYWLAAECGVRQRDPAKALDTTILKIDWNEIRTLTQKIVVESSRSIVIVRKRG